MPEPQLLSIQPLPPPSPPPRPTPPYPQPPAPQGPWPFHSQGPSVYTAAHSGEGRGRQELRKELDVQGKKRN
jgi:hypothetical protein